MSKARWWGDPREEYVCIKCPGCNEHHWLYVGPDTTYHDNTHKPHWGFNNNFDAPTFTPSLLVRSGRYAGSQRWYNELDDEHKKVVDDNSYVCHSYIRDGVIQFLGDCTHKLKGQTVPLPEVD